MILGGGGFRVPLIYRALARRSSAGKGPVIDQGIGPGIDEVVLYDTDPGRLSVIAAVLAAEVDGPRVRVELSLRKALAGADVVFSAIRVGGAAGRVRDERRALRARCARPGNGGCRRYRLCLAHIAGRPAIAPEYCGRSHPMPGWSTSPTPPGLVTEALQRRAG